MRKIAFFAAVFALFIFSAAFSLSAQTKVTPAVKKIDAYVRSVDAIRTKLKKPSMVFGDTADVESDKEKWQKFASDKALEKFRTRNEVYNIAYNWLSGGKIVQSSFTLSSPSGDWATYSDYYFRADGTLAKIRIEHRTFYGDFIMLRDIYFSSVGKVLSKTTKYQDLKTQKPKKVSEEFLEGNEALIKEVDYYLTTATLPFASLLKGK